MAPQTVASRTHAPTSRSKEITTIFREHINNPVLCDSRSESEVDIMLGYARDFACETVLKRGRADFSSGYGALTADDCVLLYGTST